MGKLTSSPLSFIELCDYSQEEPLIIGVDPDSSLYCKKAKGSITKGNGVFILNFDKKIMFWDCLTPFEFDELASNLHKDTLVCIEEIGEGNFTPYKVFRSTNPRHEEGSLRTALKAARCVGKVQHAQELVEFACQRHCVDYVLGKKSSAWKNNKPEQGFGRNKKKYFLEVTDIADNKTNEEVRSAAWFAYQAYDNKFKYKVPIQDNRWYYGDK